MIYLVTASKDASVYELYPSKNTGLDEILTVSKAYTSMDESDIARSFLQFDIKSASCEKFIKVLSTDH